MSRNNLCLTAFCALLLSAAANTADAACTVCHSKKPEMVRMHKALQSRPDIGCFACHKPGEKLMGKAKPNDRETLLQRRAADHVCRNCHQG